MEDDMIRVLYILTYLHNEQLCWIYSEIEFSVGWENLQ